MTISSKRWEGLMLALMCALVAWPFVNFVTDLVAWAVQYFNVFNWLGW